MGKFGLKKFFLKLPRYPYFYVKNRLGAWAWSEKIFLTPILAKMTQKTRFLTYREPEMGPEPKFLFF